MGSMQEIMQLCRLCLMKDQVNTPIFENVDDISQVFIRISACLPIKVSREDALPKNICENCSYKLEIFYELLNTSVASEKQLLAWAKQLGVDRLPKVISTCSLSTTHVRPLVMKQEVSELLDPHSIDDLDASDDLDLTNQTQDYNISQQQLSYETVGFEFQPDQFIDNQTTTDIASKSTPKRKRSAIGLNIDLDSEDDAGLCSSKSAKTDGIHNGESDADDTAFDDLPSTSGENDQPGPSGIGKPSDSSYDPLSTIVTDAIHQTVYECEVCTETFSSKKEFLAHHISRFGQTFTCCGCNLQCKNIKELYNHYELHKSNTIIIENSEDSTEYDYSEAAETVINLPDDAVEETNDLVYILDGSQCVNEIVIEGENEVQEAEPSEESDKVENFRIVHVEHGYMLPSIFKGQLETKRRYTRKESLSETCIEIKDENDSPSPKVVATKTSYINIPKARPKRRHEVPDFSATSYIVLNPNDEIDIVHYKCLRCEQLFISKFAFFRHIEKGKCYINSCDVCSSSFMKNTEFYEHYLTEHTDRAICNFCFRTFMYEKNVKEHMLRHLDQFRHRCEECNKGFYTVREYRNHYKNRHMGIRHKCDVCGRSFADEYYFKRHVATHEKALRK